MNFCDSSASPLISEKRTVVNGREWKGWFEGQPLPKQNAKTGKLEARLKSGQLFVDYSVPSEIQVLNVAVLGFGLQTNVTSGENRNHKLKDNFTVLAFDRYASDNGHWPIPFPDYSHTQAQRYALVFGVNPKDDLTPLQAAGGWLK